MSKNKLNVKGINISLLKNQDLQYISLTDMVAAKEGDFFVSDWLRNRNTVEFLGIWEKVNNQNFNYGEFAIIKSKTGLNNYKISAKNWIKQTKAVGIKSIPGRYGGTYAHPDIAMEFAMWISPEFKVFLIKEFQRLKQKESKKIQNWDTRRMLAKINYRVHTDAVKEKLIPHSLSKSQVSRIYAKEADVLNMALYGMTAVQWGKKNPDKKGNIRDHSDIIQLVCLAGLESLNAEFIRQGLSQKDRLLKLNEIAITQMKSLTSTSSN